MSDELDNGGGTEGGTEESVLSAAAKPAGDATAKAGEGEKKPDANAKPDEAAAKAATEKAEAAKLDAAIAKLELKLPEGFDAKDPLVSDFKKAFAQGNAQAVFDLHTKAIAAASKGFESSIEKDNQKNRAEWRSELKADKEFGGANFTATTAAVAKVMAKYPPSPELVSLLDSGLGDHPALVKWVAGIAKDLAEDKQPSGGKPANGAKPDRAAELRAAYPNSPELFTS